MTEPAAHRPQPAMVIQDEPERWPVTQRTVRYTGPVFTVATDLVEMPDGSTAERDLVERAGAVAALPYDEDTDRLLLLRQYRHPAGMALWELPAGLCDVADEPPRQTAERELFEEAHLRATDWRRLVSVYVSPGLTDETFLIYLARGLSEVPAGDRHVGQAEEAVLVPAWVDRADVVEGILAGRLGNPATVAGVLALTAVLGRPGGLDGLASD
ncbi:MAG: NUDIX hydrolase [Sporichthyaceae bacterium]|nr:NUDIX hydrolase [Sporichthyaceae bacterium]